MFALPPNFAIPPNYNTTTPAYYGIDYGTTAATPSFADSLTGYIYVPAPTTITRATASDGVSGYIYREVRLSAELERALRARATDLVRLEEVFSRLRRGLAAARASRSLALAERPLLERRDRADARAPWGFEHRRRCRTNRSERPLISRARALDHGRRGCTAASHEARAREPPPPQNS